MPDEADEFLRKWGGAPAAPVASPVDEADAFLAKWGGADPATPSFADFLKGPGSPQPVAPEPIYDPDYKRPEVTIALRPTTFRPEGEGLPKGQSGSPFGLNDLKTAGAAVGGTIVKGIDTALGAGQNLLERGFEMLPIGGQGARVADLSREGLTWEERTRGPFSRRPGGVPRPIYETTDAILAALPKSVVGDTPPTLDQAEAVLREDPAVRAGLEFSDTTGPFAGNLYGMLRGGKAIGSAVGTTEAGLALATTRVGRGALGATSFGLANWAMDPTHPVQAVTNGALAYAGMKAGEFAASPFLGRLLATAGKSPNASPLFVKALAGVAEGAGQSLAPQQHDGEWRSALLAGDWKDVAMNVAINAIFQVGAPNIPQGVKEAYIKGRAGEVPPEYMARLNTLAGPIYDTGRRLAGEARKAEAGAKPWTAADEMAAREEIRQGGATGKAAEAQLAKAKRDTYDADLVTADVLAGGKTGTVNGAVDAVLGQDKADFARESARKAELVAGPRETQALEMGEAAAEGQATREAAKAAVEPGDPAMLSRPIGGPDDWDLPVAPPAAPGAPAESAPSLALIGKTKDGRAVYGKGDSFYVRGTGGRLGAAHPKDVAEAQAAPEARPADPRKMADDLGAATGGKVEDLLSGSAVLTRGEQDAVRGAWSLLSRAIGEQGTARDVYERSPEGSTRADMADALRTIEHVYDVRVRRGQMPESEADTSLPGTALAGTRPKPRLKSADTLEAEATDKAGLAQLVRREGGIDLTGTNLTGEVNGMRLKESGTTGLVAPKGGGRSKSIQRLMDAAREEGFDIEGWTETQFVERVLVDAQGDRTLNPAAVDTEKLGAAALRRQDEAINSRLAELPPEERARIEAEAQERIRQDQADLEMERAEREAIQAEASGEMGDVDTSFDFGANVTGKTREGETVAGQVVRETDRSTIVDTPDGQRSIPKGKATKEPPGIYLGSGLGGIQPMLESTGPAIEAAAKGIARASRGFADWLRMRTVPNMTRSSPEAGSYAGGIINGTTTSSLVAPVWIERVFGENPTAETLAKFGHAAGEWQFRSRKQQLEADLAAATDDVARARIEDKLDRVGTVVGADGSPFQTKTEMDAYLDSPEFKAMAEKWREQWNRANIVDGDLLPGPERMYQDLTKRGEADPDLFTSDPRDFLRVNMKPMEPTEEGGTRPVYRTATGSLRAPMLRGHAFSREFTGAAEKYDFDPAALVQNTYQRVHRDWLKPKMYAAMERAGDAERTNLKDPEWKPPTKIKGEDVEVFPITPSRTYLRDGKSFTVPGENLYVRKSLAPEVKQTLRVNSAERQPFVMKALNTAALTGIADNVWNLMLDSMIPASAPGHIPGKVGLQAGIANNLVGMFKQLKYTLRRPEGYNETRLRLAADASWRGARGQEWTPEYVKGRLAEMANPLKIPGVAAEAVVGGLGRVAQRVHEAGRIVLDEAYTNLVKAGLVKETLTSRREFINRVGQYAGRAMGPKTEMLRDTGVQPFIVAKKKSAGEIGRKLAFSPGTQAASTSAAVQMRAGQAMRLFTFLGVIGAVNYWKTGSPTGRPGTPLGNIDLGGDDPKTGAPQSLAILGDLTGWGPALRASGATGAFGAKQQGLTDAQAIGEASKGPLNAFVYKWLSSPVLDFASRVATGKTIPQNMGGGGGPSAEPAQPGENAIANRVGFAARQAAQLGPVVTQGIDKVLGTGLTPDYAPDATNEFLDLLKTFAPKRGIRPEIMAAMPDIKNRASAAEWTEWAARQRSNMNPDEWWAWVQKTVGQSNWPSRERSSTLETLSRKRGK